YNRNRTQIMNRTAQDSIAFDFTDEACSIDGQALRLNGFGIRKLFLVEVYRVHMFSVNSIETRDQLQPGEPVRFAIRFSYGPISSDRMKQAWLDAFKKN